MKKKILLFIAIVATLMCLFAISSTASEIDYSEKVTLMDKTQVELFDENKNPLIWFILKTETLGDGSTKKTYASVSANNNKADNANSYVTYNINSTYGTNQMHDIYIKYWNAETSAYESIAENQIVVINLRGFTREYWSFGTIFDNDLEYVYHGATATNSGDYTGYTNLQVVDMSLCTNFANFGEQAFKGCTNLRVVKLANTTTEYSMNCQNGNLFNSCTSLTEIVIPDSVVSIGAAAFQNCTNLERVYISKNSKLEKIEAKAFLDCGKLTAVYLPDTLEEIGNTTASNGGAFQKCTSLYFLNDPNENTKPEIYYFPTSLTKIAGEEFSNCSSINNILVLPTGLTEIPQGYAFYNINGSSTNNSISKKYIVFLGNMTTVNLYTFNLDYVFVNPADSNCDSTTGNPIVNSATGNVNVVMSKSGPAPILYFCKAGTNGIKSIKYWENTWTNMTDADHKEAIITLVSPATCVDFAVYNAQCFCGKNLGEKKGTELNPDNHDYESTNSTLVSIVYVKYNENGTKTVTCGHGCDVNGTKTVAPLFVTKGYSIKADGYGITADYDVNIDALREYEDYANANGKTFKFGIIMANATTFGDDFMVDGILSNSYGIQLEVTRRDYMRVKASIADFTTAEKELNLVMSLYVIDDGKVSYVQHKGQGEYAGTVLNEAKTTALDVVTIQNIANLTGTDLDLPEPTVAIPAENKENQ